ncbi:MULTISPECIES: sulfurtransferase complex subunit TusD [Shewanella]|uniref:sulfurtransferase complex subunit TusD n=1 Tax=Shewanella TaxID=22 RepID=UPI0005A1A9E6|nr:MULTISPECIES: sulfurtransferase complex subunit TusD [Shewanella]KIO35283.1 sulfur transfer complex subunit TusD [Shewanella sp. cp20]MCG9746532.1 sulfurtransferase complex subunit TusD [Shewanella sp. Isolate8]MCL2909394.1 sulfurtransferase complex subunit TusD [Shewanella aquimarina]
MSKLIIQVNQAGYGQGSSYQALQFTQAAIDAGHEVLKVFFYQDGVLSTNHLQSPASDEFALYQAWRELGQTHKVPLVNCVSAALRRGVLSAAESAENQLQHWNLEPPFQMGGLGELVTGIEQADRVICF